MWQLEKNLNTCFLLTKLLNFSKERKRKSWSGDGDDNTPWHTVLGQQINHVIFLWMAGSMFVAASVLLAPMFAQRCNVIHTHTSTRHGHIAILPFYWIVITLQQDMDTFLYFHFTKLSLQWKWWDDNVSHDHNNTSALFHYKRCTSHERWGDTHPTTCYQWKFIIYII